MFLEDDDKEDKTSDKTSDDNQDKGESDDDSEDTSSDDNDSSEDNEDEGEGIAKQYFQDPKSVKPELRADFRKMQGNYTRKMQAASAAVKKAEAFDRLVLDPGFQKWMEDRRKGVVSKGRSDNGNNSEDEDEDTPVTKKDMKAYFDSLKQERTKDEQDKQLKQEFAQFKKDNPDWEIYKDAMGDIFDRYPNIAYQDAYDLAVSKDRDSESKESLAKSKKKANINKPNRTGAREGEKKGKMTIREAFELAKKNLAIK